MADSQERLRYYYRLTVQWRIRIVISAQNLLAGVSVVHACLKYQEPPLQLSLLVSHQHYHHLGR